MRIEDFFAYFAKKKDRWVMGQAFDLAAFAAKFFVRGDVTIPIGVGVGVHGLVVGEIARKNLIQERISFYQKRIGHSRGVGNIRMV